MPPDRTKKVSKAVPNPPPGFFSPRSTRLSNQVPKCYSGERIDETFQNPQASNTQKAIVEDKATPPPGTDS